MPKYLIEATYTPEGTKGILKDGGTKRRQLVEQVLTGAGGKVEAFYFAFGARDAVVIIDVPDNTTAAALALAVNASGAVALKTTVLLTPEEMDRASKKGLAYTPPGR